MIAESGQSCPLLQIGGNSQRLLRLVGPTIECPNLSARFVLLVAGKEHPSANSTLVENIQFAIFFDGDYLDAYWQRSDASIAPSSHKLAH